MGAESTLQLPYNGEMLKWARNWRGRSSEEAAERIKVKPEKIAAWEAGDAVPSVRQARMLADYYGRAFLEFFYQQAPEIVESKLIPDFRLHKGATDPQQNREILEIQHWAEAQRQNAIELFADLEEAPPMFPSSLIATLADDVEQAAELTRSTFEFSIEQQMKLPASKLQDFPKLLRGKMEGAGVLVLRRNELSDYQVRGFCIAEFPLPIIVYGGEAPSAQAFTLAHEFGHVMLRQSAISGSIQSPEGSSHDRQVERWCNRYASAFLIPKSKLVDLRPLPASPAPNIEDAVLATLAREFRVSPHAMLVRLVQLGHVDPTYYWRVKLPQFEEEARKWKASGGRPKYWASREVSKLGNLYTGLVLEAWGTGRIPYHHAAEYMGLKNPAHLGDIRREFGGT